MLIFQSGSKNLVLPEVGKRVETGKISQGVGDLFPYGKTAH